MKLAKVFLSALIFSSLVNISLVFSTIDLTDLAKSTLRDKIELLEENIRIRKELNKLKENRK